MRDGVSKRSYLQTKQDTPDWGTERNRDTCSGGRGQNFAFSRCIISLCDWHGYKERVPSLWFKLSKGFIITLAQQQAT